MAARWGASAAIAAISVACGLPEASAAAAISLVQVSAHAAGARGSEEINDFDQLFTDLPEVEEVLPNMSSILNALKSQTMELESQAVNQQKASKAALGEQRSRYQAEMAVQAHLVSTTRSANEVLRQEVDDVIVQNAHLRAGVDTLIRNNSQLRDSIKALTRKLGAATSFIGETLTSTDDEESEILRRAEAPTAAPTVKDLLRESKVDLGAGSGPASFLQLSSGVSPEVAGFERELTEAAEGRTEARGLEEAESGSPAEASLEALARHINNLATAEAAAGERIKVKFDQLLGAWKEKLEKEVKIGEELNATLAHEKATQQTLREARHHLLATRRELLLRVGGLQIFVERMQTDLKSMLEEAGGGTGARGVAAALSAGQGDATDEESHPPAAKPAADTETPSVRTSPSETGHKMLEQGVADTKAQADAQAAGAGARSWFSHWR